MATDNLCFFSSTPDTDYKRGGDPATRKAQGPLPKRRVQGGGRGNTLKPRPQETKGPPPNKFYPGAHVPGTRTQEVLPLGLLFVMLILFM